jgi:hypothetical protein
LLSAVIDQVWKFMGPLQETKLHGIVHHLLRLAVATSALCCPLWFVNNRKASLINFFGSSLRSNGVQVYSKCHHYDYVEDNHQQENNRLHP